MFFPSAKIIIRHPYDINKILLIKRKNHYEPAGGKIEIDFEKRTAESFEQCAVREAREELGLRVGIERYIGSYYFFWSIAPNKCSVSALFEGSIISRDVAFTANADTCEFAIESAWVSVGDIVNKAAPIDPLYIGLEDLLINYCKKLNLPKIS
jgi:8-oxo-dGTP pyrophosphatase MutT (NUDIX family)